MSLKLILPLLGLGSAATASAGIYSHSSDTVNGTGPGKKTSESPDSGNPNTQTPSADSSSAAQTKDPNTPESPANSPQSNEKGRQDEASGTPKAGERSEDTTPTVQKPDGTNENESLPKEGQGSSNDSSVDGKAAAGTDATGNSKPQAEKGSEQTSDHSGDQSNSQQESDSTQGGQKDGSTAQTGGASALPSSNDSAGGTGGSSTTEGTGEHSPTS